MYVEKTGTDWFRMLLSGLISKPARPADRPSLAWSPVADIMCATLRVFARQPPPTPTGRNYKVRLILSVSYN